MKSLPICAAILLLLTSGMPLHGCGGQPGSGGIEPEVTMKPFGISFAYRGKRITSLSSLYLQNGETRIGIDRVISQSENAGSWTHACKLDDGRDASVVVSPAAEEAVQMTFTVTGKDPAEKICGDLAVGAGEGFYGLMERVVQGDQDRSWRSGMTEGFDLRGQEVELMVVPTVSLYSPFFVSSAGWGAWVESDWPGTYRFGTDDPELVSLSYEGPELTVRLFPGPEPMQAVERYARTAGPPLLPPRWVFRPWRWRDEHFNLPAFYDGTPNRTPWNSMIVEDILMMEALGIPCGLYWVDRPWCPGAFGYDDLRVDPERLPDFDGMLGWLAGKGIRFMLWVAPWSMGAMNAEAEAAGFTVEAAIPSHPSDASLIDLFNPEAVCWWQDNLIPLIERGVAGFKLDRGEEKNPDGMFFRGQFHGGLDFRAGHNRFVERYAAAVHGAFERAGTEEFVVMPRAGWQGTQRHAIVWGGDTAPTEWGLRSAIIAVQRAAAIGFPVWGSDTCGYGFSSTEICMRWLAFSAFTPLMEVGPTGNIAPWSRAPAGQRERVSDEGYAYLPVYETDLVAVWIMYARLHDDLAGYSYDQAKRAAQTGTPIVRPMALAFPGIAAYRDLFDQYLYGPDILVAPIWRSGTATRQVHIPTGEWHDAWTGQPVAADSLVTVETPFYRLPVYVRTGSAAQEAVGDLAARWQAARARAAQVPDLDRLQTGLE